MNSLLFTKQATSWTQEATMDKVPRHVRLKKEEMKKVPKKGQKRKIRMSQKWGSQGNVFVCV